MVLCTERSLVKHDANRIEVRPLRCKCWKCSYCVATKQRELWWKAFKGDPERFLTLTIRKGRFATPEDAAAEMVKGWRMLRQFLERHLNIKKITFLAVFEHHKSGWPHLHILLRGSFIDHRIIRNWWKSRFDSFQIDIRFVANSRQRASYVTKYVSKAPQGFGSCKRYWCSQDWDPPKKENDTPAGSEFAWWESVTVNPIGIIRMALGDGAKVTATGDRWVIANWNQMDRWRWGIG